MQVDAEASAAQLLLCMCDVMEVTPQQRYLALWLLADQLMPTLHDKRNMLPECEASQRPPLQLFAVACLLLASQMTLSAENSGHCQQQAFTESFHVDACKLLELSFTCDKLVDAVKIVKSHIPVSEQQLTSDHIKTMHQVICNSGLAFFEPVKLNICYAILDLLYASADFRASKPLECGGKLLAAAIIGAAFAIAVKPDQVVSLPLLSWLCDLAAYPKEVVRTQTEQILVYVLH